MAISATAYQCSSDPKYVTKALTPVTSMSLQPITPLDVLSPSFRLVYSGTLNINYIFVPAFGRYYYCTPELMDGGSYILHCKVDPLMSWAAGIRASSGVVVRSESIGVPTYIPDRKLPIHPAEATVTAIKFSDTPFLTGINSWLPSGPHMVLTLLNAGGGTL